MYKRRLDKDGKPIPDSVQKHEVGPEKNADLLHGGNDTYCGSCYGAGASDEECCNTCDEARSPAVAQQLPYPNTACRALQRLPSWAPRRARGCGAPRRARHRRSLVTSARAGGQLMITGRCPARCWPAWHCVHRRGSVRGGRRERARAAQVRSAYRRRGWGFTDPQQIAQCAKEGFVEKLREQAGEGCHLWGLLNVNKARRAPHARRRSGFTTHPSRLRPAVQAARPAPPAAKLWGVHCTAPWRGLRRLAAGGRRRRRRTRPCGQAAAMLIRSRRPCHHGVRPVSAAARAAAAPVSFWRQHRGTCWRPLTGDRRGAQVAGNVHIAPGKSFQQGSMHVHDLIPFQTTEFDTSHVIDKLSFGAEYPGARRTLGLAKALALRALAPTARGCHATPDADTCCAMPSLPSSTTRPYQARPLDIVCGRAAACLCVPVSYNRPVWLPARTRSAAGLTCAQLCGPTAPNLRPNRMRTHVACPGREGRARAARGQRAGRKAVGRPALPAGLTPQQRALKILPARLTSRRRAPMNPAGQADAAAAPPNPAGHSGAP